MDDGHAQGGGGCGRNNCPRLLAPTSDSAYQKYEGYDVWILLKTCGSKVIARNTFQDAFVYFDTFLVF